MSNDRNEYMSGLVKVLSRHAKANESLSILLVDFGNIVTVDVDNRRQSVRKMTPFFRQFLPLAHRSGGTETDVQLTSPNK